MDFRKTTGYAERLSASTLEFKRGLLFTALALHSKSQGGILCFGSFVSVFKYLFRVSGDEHTQISDKSQGAEHTAGLGVILHFKCENDCSR